MKTETLKTLLILLVIGFVFSNQSLKAQNELKPVLNSGDIDRFINTHKPMFSELELLSDEIEDEEDSDNMTYDSVLRSFEYGLDNDEAVAILEKYGWEKATYGKKIMAIALGTGYLIVLKHIDDMPEEQGKAMADIYSKQYKNLVHPDDLKVLKPRITELEGFFSEE
jgi:hypothetical protein